jgi:hypothetical protein
VQLVKQKTTGLPVAGKKKATGLKHLWPEKFRKGYAPNSFDPRGLPQQRNKHGYQVSAVVHFVIVGQTRNLSS